MKLSLNRISHNLLLSGSFLAASMSPASADEFLEEQLQLAMHKPASTLASHFSASKLSAEKMLSIAEKLNSAKMGLPEEKLEFALIHSAAKKGSAEAQFRLANHYLEGDLVEADGTEAAFWYEEAIAQGHRGAKFVYENLGVADFDMGC